LRRVLLRLRLCVDVAVVGVARGGELLRLLDVLLLLLLLGDFGLLLLSLLRVRL
jgi:hypothetical protein